MTLQQLSDLAQIIGSVGVVLSLIFVGLQIRQNTAATIRGEHNATMAQWTVVRMKVAESREMAELMTAGLRGQRPLDEADQLRLDQMLTEIAYAGFHIWDRTQRGYFPKGTFEITAGVYLTNVLETERGAEWWRSARIAGMIPAYVAYVDAMLEGGLAVMSRPHPLKATADATPGAA